STRWKGPLRRPSRGRLRAPAFAAASTATEGRSRTRSAHGRGARQHFAERAVLHVAAGEVRGKLGHAQSRTRGLAHREHAVAREGDDAAHTPRCAAAYELPFDAAGGARSVADIVDRDVPREIVDVAHLRGSLEIRRARV